MNSDIKIAKKFYYKNSLNENKNDSRRTCQQTVNELTTLKTNTSSVKELIVNAHISVTTPSDILDTFNEHFPKIVPKLASEITLSANGHSSCLEYLNIADKVSF